MGKTIPIIKNKFTLKLGLSIKKRVTGPRYSRAFKSLLKRLMSRNELELALDSFSLSMINPQLQLRQHLMSLWRHDSNFTQLLTDVNITLLKNPLYARICNEIQYFRGLTLPKAPLNYSHWVIPERLIASAYPGHTDQTISNVRLNTLIKAGVTVFVSLVTAAERMKYGQYEKHLTGMELDFQFKRYHRIYVERYDKEITFSQIEIEDQKVIDDSSMLTLAKELIALICKGETVLIHCLAGKGRTGTLVAIIIGLLYNVEAPISLLLTNNTFMHREEKGTRNHRMPQTEVQYDQVARILSHNR
jgi:hypothetical protein